MTFLFWYALNSKYFLVLICLKTWFPGGVGVFRVRGTFEMWALTAVYTPVMLSACSAPWSATMWKAALKLPLPQKQPLYFGARKLYAKPKSSPRANRLYLLVWRTIGFYTSLWKMSIQKCPFVCGKSATMRSSDKESTEIHRGNKSFGTTSN